MSTTFKRNCGIPIDFEGFQNARCPQDVVVFHEDFNGINKSGTADAAVWKETIVKTGITTAVCLDGTDDAEDEGGGILKIATDATISEGDNLQVNGEMFHLADGYPLYCEARINVSDISDLDLFIGLSVTDADILSGVTDRVGFELVNGVLKYVCEKDSSSKEVDCVITETDDDWIRVGFFWDGDDKVIFTVDTDDDGVFDYKGTLLASTSAHCVAQDAMMTPTIEAIARTTTTPYMYADYITVIQRRFKE